MLLKTVIASLCMSLCFCGGTPSKNAGYSPLDAGKCVARPERYNAGTKFAFAAGQDNTTLPSCIPTCGDSPNVDGFLSVVSLPAGNCESSSGATSCDMGAHSICPCPGDPGNVDVYRCRCVSGRWSCVVISQGAGGCARIACDDGG